MFLFYFFELRAEQWKSFFQCYGHMNYTRIRVSVTLQKILSTFKVSLITLKLTKQGEWKICTHMWWIIPITAILTNRDMRRKYWILHTYFLLSIKFYSSRRSYIVIWVLMRSQKVVLLKMWTLIFFHFRFYYT